MSGRSGKNHDHRPLYARIAQILRDDILAGRHAVGALLPTEAELCARFRVSRYTVREALRRLSEAGFVERRQGAGTLVVSGEPRKVFAQSVRTVADLLQYAVDTKLVAAKTTMIRAEEKDAATIGAPPGTDWLKIEGHRRDAAGEAICAVEVFIDARFAGIANDLPELKGPIFTRIEERFGATIAEVDQEISAGELPAPVARALGRMTHAVGMRFRRRYLDDKGAVILTSINWHPADRFVYAMRLKRGEE